ncbi:MAG: hypothetical protein LBE78_07005 [Burkholderiaceae bacterium]|jgi:hypothetical protein|nr:hypothetical protein [Burkholderiaceae bacterium]
MNRWETRGIATLIALLLALGIGLRCTGLQDQGLWTDELFSADLIVSRPLLPSAGVPWLERRTIFQIGETESFWTIKAADQSPPLFELIGKAATTLLGTSETALRVTSAAAGVMFLLWVAARAWRYRRDTARMAYLCLLGMTALSGPLVFYAKEARAYSLAAALCGVLTVKFWERWRQGWRVASLPGWGEAWAFAAVAWTHYTALALAALMWLAYSWEALRRRAWRAETRLAVMPLALLAWLALSWHGFRLTVQGRTGWGLQVDLDTVLAYLVSNSLSQISVLLHGWPGWIWLLTLLAAGMAWANIRFGRACGDSPAQAGASMSLMRASAATLALCAGFFLLFIGMAVASHIAHLRHLLFVFPGLYLTMGGLLSLVQLRWRWPAWLLLILLLAAQYPLLQRHLAIEKTDFRAVATFVRARLQPGDSVLAGTMLNPSAIRYYLPNTRPGKHQPSASWHRIYYVDKFTKIPELCHKLSEAERFGVMAFDFYTDQINTLRDACGANYDIESIESFEYFGQVWRRKSSASAAPSASGNL